MYEIHYGSKVEQTEDLPTKECARLMRVDVKEYKRRGMLPPDLKTSIRYESFSGGCAIRVAWSLPGRTAEQVYRPEWLRYLEVGGNDPNWFDPETGWTPRYKECYTPEVAEIVRTLETIHGRYNYDGSEIQVDYFHVRFYGHFEIDYTWERELRAGMGDA